MGPTEGYWTCKNCMEGNSHHYQIAEFCQLQAAGTPTGAQQCRPSVATQRMQPIDVVRDWLFLYYCSGEGLTQNVAY